MKRILTDRMINRKKMTRSLWENWNFPREFVERQTEWEFRHRMLVAFESGASVPEIAKHLSFSTGHIHQLLKRAKRDRLRPCPMIRFFGDGDLSEQWLRRELVKGLDRSFEMKKTVNRDWLMIRVHRENHDQFADDYENLTELDRTLYEFATLRYDHKLDPKVADKIENMFNDLYKKMLVQSGEEK